MSINVYIFFLVFNPFIEVAIKLQITKYDLEDENHIFIAKKKHLFNELANFKSQYYSKLKRNRK